MRAIVASSLRYRFVVIGAAAALLFFGAQTLGRQKVDVFPEFAPPIVEVQTEALGLSPSEVESLVTVPIEYSLHGIPRVQEIRSESVQQLSAIWLYFRQGTDVVHARQLVQERLQAIAPTLPTWASPPTMYPIVSATSRVMQIGLASRTLSPLDLSMVAQWTVRPRLLEVPGVANVAIWGLRQKEFQVQAKPTAMAARRVALDDLLTSSANAVEAGDLEFAGSSLVGTPGFVDTPSQRLMVQGNPAITTPAQLASAIVTASGADPVRIGQVANVNYGVPPLIGDAVVDGRPGLMLVVEKFPDANTLDVTAGVDRALAALKPGLPGITIDSHIFRQATFIKTAISNLSAAVILGSVLVVFVLIAFLFQWRAAFVSMLAIPLSLLAAAIVLKLTGATINTMVLAGFGVSVGVVVDDAIIGMENIVRRLRQRRAEGKRITPAALVLAASMEVRVAMWYATLINIVAVLPVMLVAGLTGSFFSPLALAYGLAVLASMLVALTVTPALGLALLSGAALDPEDPPLMRWLKRGYGALLRPVLEAPWRTLASVAALAALGLLILPQLGSDLFPTFKEPDLLMHFVTKPGTSLPEQDRQVTRVQQELLPIPGIAQVGTHVGQAVLGEEVAGVNFSENWISLAPGSDYAREQQAVRAVANSHPGVYTDVSTYLRERIDEVLTSGATQDLVIRVYGPDLDTLRGLAAALAHRLHAVHGLDDIQPQPQRLVPEAQIQVNLAAARRYGLTPGAVFRTAGVLISSEPVATVIYGGKFYPLTVWSTPRARSHLDQLGAVPIDTSTGGRIPLSAVASVRVRPAPSDIVRVNGQRAIEVYADIAGGSLGAVTAGVRYQLAQLHLPPGYHAQLLGQAVERAAAQKRLLTYGLAAAIAIFFLLQAGFRSTRLAGLMFLTLPIGLVGGVITAWAALGTVTLGALVGFFTVFGIAARNGILMLAHFQHLEHEEGEPFGTGLVLRGAAERLSPILMTALATALALAPLVIFGNRPGQEIEHPMAIVILGGLATATLMNLFVVPVLYLLLGRARSDARVTPITGE